MPMTSSDSRVLSGVDHRRRKAEASAAPCWANQAFMRPALPCSRRSTLRATTLDPVLVVRGDDDGDADLMEGGEDFENFARRVDIEVAGRLVGEQDGRAIDDGAGNRQPLLFAAGKRDRPRLLARQQADLVERRLRAADRLAPRQADDLQRQHARCRGRCGRTAASGPGRPGRNCGAGREWRCAAGPRGSGH